MMYALCNYRITNINVGSNLLGNETSLSARKLVREGYSLSHIVQITDFGDFLHEYCDEKSKTFIEF